MQSFFAAPTLDRFMEHPLPSAHVDRLSVVPPSAVSNATGSVRRFEDDVVLLVRTGTTSLFEHLPMMLLAQQDTNEYRPNQVYYSDAELSVAGVSFHDALWRVTDRVRSYSDFAATYNRIQELVVSSLGSFQIGPDPWQMTQALAVPHP